MTIISSEASFSIKGFGMLLRVVAVVSSSLATILSNALPLYFYTDLTFLSITNTTLILFIGALIIHGLLTHSLNDVTDYRSGTDTYSPGILSGGSRVLQTGTLSLSNLRQIASWITVFLVLSLALFLYFDYKEFALLTLIGLWGAISYSVKPFQLAYYPFVGEWLSLFPTMFCLGLAPAWILLDNIPLWAWQNASVNALFCMAWVMVHHIPDRDADRQAKPVKQTTVVWAEDIFGEKGTKLPSYLYFFLVACLLLWISLSRPFTVLGAGLLLLYSLIQVKRMETKNLNSVTSTEKKLLLTAFTTALWLGLWQV